MRVAILSDIHANLPALEAVLEALGRESPDAYICAGDIVGYGAFPNECIEIVSQLKNVVSVAGNHDLIAIGLLSDAASIRVARETLRWTSTVLTEGGRAFLRSLPLRTTAFGMAIAHGSLTDPQEYVRSAEQIVAQLSRLAEEEPNAEYLVLGHTHRLGAWTATAARLRVGRGGWLDLPSKALVLVNPGSVGQSRDFTVRAQCLLIDTTTKRALPFRLRYDTRRCRAELARVGLPRDAYHLPAWRTARRLAPVRRLARRLMDLRR